VPTERPLLALGLEGSANKFGAGIIRHDTDGATAVLSNVRHTYITPPGEGFQPKDTALHHREWAFKVIKDAVAQAGVTLHEIDCICYTKGARTLSVVGSRRVIRAQVPEWVPPCSLSP
jgi:N6-L-threonylcarbamoyladenine synthase